jgi:hypothetical protein
LDQGGSAAVRGFRILRNQEFFKKIHQKVYIVWADCGPHFRTQKFIGFLLIELASIGIRGQLKFKLYLKLTQEVFFIVNLIFFANITGKITEMHIFQISQDSFRQNRWLSSLIQARILSMLYIKDKVLRMKIKKVTIKRLLKSV